MDCTRSVAQDAAATRGYLTDFKQFLLRGNVVDLAVGIVIGSAVRRRRHRARHRSDHAVHRGDLRQRRSSASLVVHDPRQPVPRTATS